MKDKLIWFILPMICKYLAKQGYHHKWNIERYFEMMIVAAHREFTEDSPMGLNHWLVERFAKNIDFITIETK